MHAKHLQGAPAGCRNWPRSCLARPGGRAGAQNWRFRKIGFYAPVAHLRSVPLFRESLSWRPDRRALLCSESREGGTKRAPVGASRRWAGARGRFAPVSKNIRLQHEATFLRFRHVTSWPLFFHGEISRSTCLLQLPSYCCHCRLQTPLAPLCPRVSPPAAQTCVPPALRN